MDLRRLWRTFRLWTNRDRCEYIRKAHIFSEFGDNSTMSSRKVPLYPELIHIGNNVIIGAGTLVKKDFEGGWVYAGVPAKKICTFEDFVEKRMVEEFLRKCKRTGDSVDVEFAKYLYEQFCLKHRIT